MSYSCPLISVIIPLYNKESSIKDTIHSVLHQSFDNFELIIINDGSTDNSLKVISQLSDSRLKVFSIPNEGVSNARNTGVEKAIGKYIFFLDADDIILKDCLRIFSERAIVNLDKHIFVSDFNILFKDGKLKRFSSYSKEGVVLNIEKNIWKRHVFPRTGATLISKSCFDQINPWFNTKISIYEDMEFILRLVNVFDVYYIPEVVLNYQLEYNSLSKKVNHFSKEWVYHMDDNTFSGGFYKKMIVSEIVYNTYMKWVKANNKDVKKMIEQKNIKHLGLILYSIFTRGRINFFNKISRI